MRLFTAITLPDFVRKELAVIQPRHPNIHLTPESQMHLTLRFIGDADKPKTRRIIQALSHVSFPPFDLEIAGTGIFPRPREPVILWAGVRYHPVLTELYDFLQEELYRAGVPAEKRSYHPHVTLGRIRIPPELRRNNGNGGGIDSDYTAGGIGAGPGGGKAAGKGAGIGGEIGAGSGNGKGDVEGAVRGEHAPPVDDVMHEFLHGEPSRFYTTFRVEAFHLYHSRQHSGGAIHHCLQGYAAS